MYGYKRVSYLQTSSPADPAAQAAAADPLGAEGSNYSASVWAGPGGSASIPTDERIDAMWVSEVLWSQPLSEAGPPPAGLARSLRKRLIKEYKWLVKLTKPKVRKIKKEVKKKGKDIKAKGQENAKKLGKKVKGFVAKLAEKAKGQ
ncbi:MAG: hypothetical protein LQ344_007359 [Seirophora lacunosa]|nr:MAG: hypothetical protein LQ344_007359 [Seirophora lacunosa]